MSTPTSRTNLSFDRMTEVACLSPYPWSRIYSAMRGETIVATIRRLRLQRAVEGPNWGIFPKFCLAISIACRTTKGCGDPGRTPTCDLGFRKALLYAAELRGRRASSLAGRGGEGKPKQPGFRPGKKILVINPR